MDWDTLFGWVSLEADDIRTLTTSAQLTSPALSNQFPEKAITGFSDPFMPLDNIEGLTFGPNCRWAAVINRCDNNFQPAQRTQVLTLLSAKSKREA